MSLARTARRRGNSACLDKHRKPIPFARRTARASAHERRVLRRARRRVRPMKPRRRGTRSPDPQRALRSSPIPNRSFAGHRLRRAHAGKSRKAVLRPQPTCRNHRESPPCRRRLRRSIRRPDGERRRSCSKRLAPGGSHAMHACARGQRGRTPPRRGIPSPRRRRPSPRRRADAPPPTRPAGSDGPSPSPDPSRRRRPAPSSRRARSRPLDRRAMPRLRWPQPQSDCSPRSFGRPGPRSRSLGRRPRASGKRSRACEPSSRRRASPPCPTRAPVAPRRSPPSTSKPSAVHSADASPPSRPSSSTLCSNASNSIAPWRPGNRRSSIATAARPRSRSVSGRSSGASKRHAVGQRTSDAAMARHRLCLRASAPPCAVPSPQPRAPRSRTKTHHEPARCQRT